MRDRLTPAQLRERAGITQQQVAIALNKSVSTVQKWEQFTNRLKLSPFEMIQVLRVYQCSIEELAIAFDRVDPDEI